jgi:serine/threonine-protein kinase SRPK3
MVASQQSGWPKTRRAFSDGENSKILIRFILTCRRDGRWVAIKFVTADASSTQGRAELEGLRSLGAQFLAGSGPKHVVQLLDHFVHQGPNGSHTCLVLELLGPSLDSVILQYLRQHQNIPARRILRFSKQLLQAVDFVHASGMAYGGGSAL